MDTPIDVILLTHNKLDNTMRCIDHLYRNTDIPFGLTVIDDSDDRVTPVFFEYLIEQKNKEQKYVHYYRPNIVIRSGNQAINIGLRETKSDPVIFLTNSTWVEPGWLPVALQIMAGDPKVGTVGFKLLFPDTSTIIEAGAVFFADTAGRVNVGMHEPSHRYTHIREVDAVGWAVILLRRAALPVNGLEEDYYIGFRGSDDVDNCLEMKKRGWKVIYNGYGAAYHKLGACIGLDSQQGQIDSMENSRRFQERWRTAKAGAL